MSYSKDLEEYTDSDLVRELERRSALRDEGKCSYCKRALGSAGEYKGQTCRYHEGGGKSSLTIMLTRYPRIEG